MSLEDLNHGSHPTAEEFFTPYVNDGIAHAATHARANSYPLPLEGENLEAAVKRGVGFGLDLFYEFEGYNFQDWLDNVYWFQFTLETKFRALIRRGLLGHVGESGSLDPKDWAKGWFDVAPR
ncbi:hypothetical protein H9P43_005403 [Blastocladiella emersonii ATCC 22665]|nr:hypothetical protein H9P43_005403 [Blastocladiella emersonii ATCC 22665]